MSAVNATRPMGTYGLHSATTSQGLSAIRRSDCAASIWERRSPPRLERWIDNVAPEHLPKARLILRADRVCDALVEVTNLCNTPTGPERDLLIDDVSALSAIFADVMQTTYLRLRLDVVRSNACRKFHIDAVTARLICTYRGTGTQYGISTDGAEPTRIFTTPTGAPLILRGTLWPTDPPAGLLHRSPPIEGSGETRLLLVLDPVDDPEGAI